MRKKKGYWCDECGTFIVGAFKVAGILVRCKSCAEKLNANQPVNKLFCSECYRSMKREDMVEIYTLPTGEIVLGCKSCKSELEREAEEQLQEDIDDYWNMVRQGLR